MYNLSNSRILVVEDTKIYIDTLVETLSEYYQVGVAMDGETALQDIKENKPDLILLDIMMPGMDGYEVCIQLKADSELADIPIIFLTAKTEMEDIIKGFECGSVDYVTKPFNLTELLMRVRTHLELKAAREEIQKQNEELVKAAEYRKNVDHIMRHDLKAPLNPIIGFPQILLERENLSEKGRKYLRMIKESGYKMLNMINLSLDLFKMEQGIYSLQPSSVDILPQIINVKEEFESLIQRKNISVEIELFDQPLKDDDSFYIRGEDLLCYSMLANLIKNALEASPENKRIKIMIHENQNRAIIKIHNTGAVPADIRTRFFDIYASSGKREGTGLGTYSAKLIAKTLNGDIDMETSEQEGTTITIELPIS